MSGSIALPNTPLATAAGPGSTIVFQPSEAAPFQFQAELDGATYTVLVTWNISGQRFYVNIFDQTATRILTLPLIGSPSDRAISLTAGYFTTSLVFRQATQTFEIG